MQESIEIVRYKHQLQVSKYEYNIWLMKLEVDHKNHNVVGVILFSTKQRGCQIIV